jgi:acyl-coenzyme A thioesterase 13
LCREIAARTVTTFREVPTVSAAIPAGFGPILRSSPFLDSIGPLYSRGSGGEMVIGLRVEKRHTNARGALHGGVVTTLADVALGYALATSTEPPTPMVTVSLSVDFVGAAQVGDWIETRVEVQKLGSRLAFANASFTVGGERIARASGVFLVVKRPAEER